MTIVHIGGAKGVGKTTILHRIEETEDLTASDTGIVNSSDLIFKFANKVFKKDWADLNTIQKRESRRAVGEYIRNLPNKTVIVDGHYVGEIVGGVPVPTDFGAFNKLIGCHIVIEAPLELVVARRREDKSKYRNVNIDSVKEEMRVERETAMKLANETGVNFYIVENIDVQNAARELLSLLRKDARVKM